MKIVENIYLYPLDKPIKHFLGRGSSINVFTIDQGNEIWMIDTGVKAAGRAKYIVKQMKKDGLKPENISKIFITHAHADHYNALDFFKKLSSPNVLVHEEDEHLLSGGEKIFWQDQEKAAGDLKDYFLPIPLWLVFPLVGYVLGKSPIVEPDKLLHDRDVIHGNSFDIEVIHTPGHTKGSSCFFIPQLNLLFSGDLIGLNIKNAKNKPPMNLATSDYDDFHDSYVKLLDRDIEILCGSHADKIYFGKDEIQHVIKNTLKNLETVREIVIDLLGQHEKNKFSSFKGKMPKPMFPATHQLTAAYAALKSLMKEGRVEKIGREFRLINM